MAEAVHRSSDSLTSSVGAPNFFVATPHQHASGWHGPPDSSTTAREQSYTSAHRSKNLSMRLGERSIGDDETVVEAVH